ncbi:MAG: hypothetical protein KDB14_19240 [Planctomycetales bacterium]|nr:hypothetical protein [Planctomycetales bacterium]
MSNSPTHRDPSSRPDQSGQPTAPMDWLSKRFGWLTQPMHSTRQRAATWLTAGIGAALLLWSASVFLPWTIVLSVSVVTAIGLSKRSALATPTILIVALGTPLLLSWRERMMYDGWYGVDIRQALALVLLVALLVRYLELDVRGFQRWRLGGRGEARNLDALTGEPIHEPVDLRATSEVADAKDVDVEQSASGQAIESSNAPAVTAYSWGLLRAPLAMALAIYFLSALPFEKFVVNQFRFDPSVYRVVTLAWLLALAATLPTAALGMLRWRRLSAEQAALHLRQTLASEAEPEFRLLERARAKFVDNKD